MDSKPPPSVESILPHLGPEIMREVSALLAQSVLYGLYFMVLGVAVYIERGLISLSRTRTRKSSRGKAWIATIAATATLFVISTFLWVSNIVVFMNRLNIIFVQTQGTLVSRIYLSNDATVKIRTSGGVMFIIAYLIGDGIVVVPRLTLFADQSLDPLPDSVSYAAEVIEWMLWDIVARGFESIISLFD
ncbi:hypothetical protein EXIGLDRAFT_775361 [Exidia glandulosa HHB12029]|uniref:Uncharacterized protein n=1 Tax=Exidia glandulosa HHB12029 TaxID=1314781 RepID=A0A165DY31_EXIGL|nr:hypothetical protein EXIGLDRAFT_775361 [Exidia glandulosa HHB12029]